jgi:hypothetical protein
MKKLILFISFVSVGISQNTPAYPTRIATTTDIPLASENFTTSLSAAMSIGASSISVVSTTGASVPIILYIDPNTTSAESIMCVSKTSNSFTVCTPGFNGSTQRSHNSGAVVSNNVSPYYVNQLAAEVISIESDLFNRILTSYGKTIALYDTTPVINAIPVYTTSTNLANLTPSVCTIVGSTITCPSATSNSITLPNPTHFANLPAATQGTFTYCDTCNVVASPFTCTGGGAGAWAFANGTIWKCPF